MTPPAAAGVVMVSASFHPHIGGAEKQALELSVALRARGMPVLVATRRLSGFPVEEEIRGVPVHRLWRAGTGLIDAATFLASLSWFLFRRRASYAAIHAHLAGSPALAAALMGRLLDKRVVVKLGGGAGIGELAVSAKTPAGRIKLKLFTLLRPRFIAVAQELADEARRYLGPVSVEVVPNGVDVACYKPAESVEKRLELRRALGWPEKALIFLYVGRLSPEKRLPAFTQAWAEASRRVARDCFLAMIGAGPEESAIRMVADYTRCKERIKIHAPTAEVQAAYAAADVFVLPSISEGLSNALLEALASGLPALASRVGGTPEAVTEGLSGFLFSPMDES